MKFYMSQETIYAALKILDDKDIWLWINEWTVEAFLRGVYKPQKVRLVTRRDLCHWGYTTGVYLANFGLVQKRMTRVGSRNRTSYTLTNAGRAWIEIYNAEQQKKEE